VPKIVPATADARGLEWLDATCPLVSKVHRQVERLVDQGKHILFIGHAGHPEVIGTFGQVPDGNMTLVETVEDVAKLPDLDGSTLFTYYSHYRFICFITFFSSDFYRCSFYCYRANGKYGVDW
jgi:4-hydroxy-3-methylbut-2-enyl diphosphate reductase